MEQKTEEVQQGNTRQAGQHTVTPTTKEPQDRQRRANLNPGTKAMYRCVYPT